MIKKNYKDLEVEIKFDKIFKFYQSKVSKIFEFFIRFLGVPLRLFLKIFLMKKVNKNNNYRKYLYSLEYIFENILKEISND